MEKLERKDVRFLLICLAVVVLGGATTAVLFRRAFPEASIRFEVNREQARVIAEKWLSERERGLADSRFAGRFGIEEVPKVYLERELGLERAGAYYGRDAKVWRWEMRWFRSGVKEEERVEITPLGDLVAFDSIRREDAPGARLSREEARAISNAFLSSRGIAANLIPIEAVPRTRPNRTDWTFVDERAGFRMGEATVRYATTVSGSEELTGYREFVHVPESWTRDYERLRSKNNTTNVVGNLLLFLTFLAMGAVLVTKIVRKDVRWGIVGAVGAIGAALSLLSTLNGLPLTLYGYDTASPLSAFLTSRLVLGALAAIGVGALLAFVIASAEPVYREQFPSQLSLSGLFSRRGLRSKRFFLGLVLGYALTAFFFAYQAVFYVVAARFGAWSPAEIPYDDILNTRFPWVTVLFIGFLPAVLEEGSSRMFSISFLKRLGAGRFVALVVPGLIWGMNHTAYPNQPFWIRGVEVGLAGVVIGALMLRFGVFPLLVWHFTVDALYTALLLLRSGNTYFVGSGAVSALILLLPLAVAGFLYARRGGFESESGLTNGEEGFVPPPARAVRPLPLVPEVRPLAPGVAFAMTVAAAALATSFLVHLRLDPDLVEDATGRARAESIAREFLRVNGTPPERFHSVCYFGTGFAEDQQLREIRPEESGAIPPFSEAAAHYLLSQGGLGALEKLSKSELPLGFWVVRFFQPLKKEEWKILVDVRRGRVVAFVNPKEEAAPAPPGPDSDRARSRALSAAAALGYPRESYSVADIGTRKRPNRTDTTVVLEARPGGVGEARPRLTEVFQGSRLATVLPSIQVPEGFLREYRKRLAVDWILIALRVVALGSVLGAAFVLFLRIVRAGVAWRTLVPPLIVAAALGAAAVANSLPTVTRAYPTATPLSDFRVTVAVGLLLVWVLQLCVAGITFVLFSQARPGWTRARLLGGFRTSLGRAAICVLGLAGLSRWTHVAAVRWPVLFGFEPDLPRSLETAVPGFAVLWSAARATAGLAALAALVALASRQPFFRKPAGRSVAAAILLVGLLPTTVRSPGEFAADYVPALLVAGWLAICGLILLADDVAAWALFGVLAFGGRAALDLLAQPAPSDRLAGWAAILFLLVGAAAFLAGRRRIADAAPSEAAPIS